MEKHIAKLSNGGELELTLPLLQASLYGALWRLDQHGVLVNLAHVASIGPAEPAQQAVQDIREAAKKLVALVDRDGDRWYVNGREEWFLGETGKNAHARAEIEDDYGPVREVWG